MHGKAGFTIETDVAVQMSDGTTLATDIFRPSDGEKYPAVLVRTPYGKGGWSTHTLLCPGTGLLEFVRAGYAVIFQDARGTGASQGRFIAHANDGKDGADAIKWIARQRWCNGSVGMAGASYQGGTQLLTAVERPSALRVIIPTVPFLPESLHQGGALRLGFALMWAAFYAPKDEDLATTGRDEIFTDPAAAYRALPLRAAATRSPGMEELYGRWLEWPLDDRAIITRSQTTETPAMHIAGWHDPFLREGLSTFKALRAYAATEEARAAQHLLITPWGHELGGSVVGESWLGPGPLPDLHSTHQEWFDHYLKGAELPERATVRIFVQGANRWRDASDWPLSQAKHTRWYLQPGGGMSRTPPAESEPDEFLYDPGTPLPSTSGQASVAGAEGAFVVGPRDRQRLHGRPDVVVYTSDRLAEDTEVTGEIVATLFVSSSATDTDFTATLIDFHPDGRAIGVTDGILRLRFRRGVDRVELIDPYRPYQINVDLVATSNVFKAGHRIGLEISSSNFPRFDRNPNHGGDIARATASDFAVAVQRVFHDPERASYVTLPIIDDL